MNENRENWTAILNSNGRYIVIDKTTGSIINDAQGFGFTSESKCWNWIRNMQRQVGIEIEHQQPKSNPLF